MIRPRRPMTFLVAVSMCLAVHYSVRGDEASGVLPASTSKSIENLVSTAIQQGKLPGAVVVAATSQEVLFAKTYGHRQIAPSVEAMTLDTRFDLASLTKPIATATSLFLLLDAGQVNVDDLVVDHLPEFDRFNKSNVQLKHLLLHTSGLTPDNALADYQKGNAHSWQRIFDLQLRSKPGEKFAYSDVGFLVLQKIIEAKSKQPLNQFSARRIFEPLGMTATGYRPLAEDDKDNAASQVAPTHERPRGEVHDPRAHALGGVAGHAGLFSTAGDLVKYGRMMLRRGEIPTDDIAGRDERLLSEATWSLMVSPHDVGRGTRTLGWDHQSPYSSNRGADLSDAAFGHGGFTGTVLWIDPKNDFVFVFLSNRLHPDGEGSVNQLAGNVCSVLFAAMKTSQQGVSSEKTAPTGDSP